MMEKEVGLMMKAAKTVVACALLFACLPAAGAAGSPLVQVYPTRYEQVYADDQHAIVTDDAVIAGAHWWFGVYALDGSVIIPREYTSISWRDGYYIASNASGNGVYASDGALLLPVEYDKIELDPEEDVAFACKDQQYGLYSLTERKWIIPLQQANYAAYHFGIPAVIIDDRYYACDGTLLKESGENVGVSDPDRLIFSENGKKGVRDFSGKVIIPAEYDQINTYAGWNKFAVEKDGKWGLIDRDGKEVCPVQYDGYEDEDSGVLLYRNNGEKKDYYLPDGTCLATGVDAIIKWHGNALEIQNGWEYGVVDQTGREILPCIYDSSPTLDPYVDFIALSRKVKADGSATETRNDVVVSKDGKVMIPEGRYDELRVSYDYGTDDEAVWCFNDGKLCAIYDVQGRKITTAPFPIEDWMDGENYYWPQLGLYSAGDCIYTTDGDCILQADFIRTDLPGSNAIYIRRDGKWQVAMLHPYDGSPSAWAEPEIAAADSAGILPDYLKISWDTPISREDFCVLVMQALHQKGIAADEASLSDPFTDTHHTDVVEAYALGIVNGVGNGRFAPDESITREEAAKMLWNAAALLGYQPTEEPLDFADKDEISDWALESVNAISSISGAGRPIMQGTGNNRFSPKDSYTREQAVATVYRLYAG